MTAHPKRVTRTRDNNRCIRCNTPSRMVVARKNGGPRTVTNMQTLCPRCREWRTQNPADAYTDGYLIPTYGSDNTWPGHRVGVGWVVYYDTADEHGDWWQTVSEDTAALLMGRHT